MNGSSKKVGESHSPFNISAWSIDHPYMIIAFYLGIAILAVIAIGGYMPKRFTPYVESPMIGIVTMNPGYTAEEMETYISKPIEERMVNIPGVRYIRSTSQNGFSIVSLEFPYGSNMDKKMVNVLAIMKEVQADLPIIGSNVKPSWVLKIDPLNVPVLSLALTGDSRWDMSSLRQLADNQITNQIKMCSTDIYTVKSFGGYRRQLQVIVDRNKLAAYGISILQVKNALDGNNADKSGGAIETRQTESIIQDNTLANDVHTVENYPIASKDGSIIYLKDVAKVEDTYYYPISGYQFYHRDKNGPKAEKAIEISVLQSPSASSPIVIAKVMKELKTLETEFPGIHFQVAYDNSRFVGILMHNMFEELGMAILLTGLATLLFLGNWRGTIIAMTAIPFSLAMALLALIPLGMTLNSSTLIGLLLSIGRLVDDSIIDIHSVERHLRMGKSSRDATIDGITEVRTAVAASTIMLCLALSPLLFCGGIVQLMFVGLVWPIIFGLLASFLVSLTLTSLMAAHLLKSENDPVVIKERKGVLYRFTLFQFQLALDKLEHGYSKLIVWMQSNRFVVVAAALITIIIGFGFYYFIGSEMMPLADVGQASMSLEMNPGTSYHYTELAVKKVERIMAQYPEVRDASIEIGNEGGPGYTGGAYYNGYTMGLVNSADGMITFTDKNSRKRSIWRIMDDIVGKADATIPGIRRFQIKEMGSDVMASSEAPIQLLVYGPNLQVISKLANKVANIARTQVPDIYQVGTSWVMGQPDYQIHVDPRRAKELGMSVTDVMNQSYYATLGGFADEFYHLPNLRQTTVFLRYQKDQSANPYDLGQMMITTPKGNEVPLKSIATVKFRYAPSIIEHDNFRREVSVTGFYRDAFYHPSPIAMSPYQRTHPWQPNRPSMDVAMDLMMRAQMQLNWPPGYGIEMRGDMTQMMDSFHRLLGGLELAILFIFLTLIAQFKGFIQPFQMVFSLPLELSGVFIALFLMGQAFSTVSIMAVIVLTGMDITTAILLIDLIIRFRESGVPRDEAVRRACPERLRPILMTSIITLIAMSPVAFAPKTGMDAYQPLGVVIVGGLIIGTALSLLVIPIMHTIVDDVVVTMNGWFRKRGDASADITSVSGEGGNR